MSKPKSLDDFIGCDDNKEIEDDISFSSTDDEGSTSRSASTSSSKREKQEVYKMSAKDTFRVQLWRVAVTVVLLLTAFAVTYTTYLLLKQEEKSNFEVAVRNTKQDKDLLSHRVMSPMVRPNKLFSV